MLCKRPTNSIFFNSNGGLRPDVRYARDIANIDDYGSLRAYMESSQLRRVQQTIETDPNCASCRLSSKSSSFDPRDTVNDRLTTLYLGLSNVCNLQCRMCGSHASNQLIERDQNPEFFPNPTNSTKRLTQEQVNMLMADLKLFEGLREIRVGGGEPFIESINFDILERLIPYAGNIDLYLITNATVVPTKDQQRILDHYKSVTITVGLEATGAMYEYVRHGASWENCQEVTWHISNLYETRFFVSLTAMTVLDMQPLLDYIGERDVSFQTVVIPSYLNHQIFGRQLIDVFPEELHDFVPEEGRQKDQIEQFQRYIEYLDDFYGTSLYAIQPGIRDLF